jgi:DNA polymerase-1
VQIRVRGYNWDTTYANYLKNTWIRKHGLEAISDTLYPAYAGYKEIIAPYVKDRDFTAIPLEVMRLYNGADCSLTKEIELDSIDEVSQPLMTSYIRAGFTLARMEQTGPNIDELYLAELEALIPRTVQDITNKLRVIAGRPNLNPNKADDIAWLLYKKLKIPIMDEESAGATEEAVLQIIYQKHKHPVIPLILDYRKFSKMDSTYLRSYRECVKVNNGQLRTKWYLTGAATGRLRSGGKKDGIAGVVNMQNLHGSTALKNLLISDPRWRKILELLDKDLDRCIAKKSGLPDDILDLEVFLAADYSQIEIRMLAEVSGDPGLIAAFQAGADIHCSVGHDLTGKSHEEIKNDKDFRSFIKNCHFGLVYGLSEEGLYFYLKAKGIDTTEEKAAKFHRDYFHKYRKVKTYIDRMRGMAERDGFVKTIFDFRRIIGIEEDRDTNPENQAVNSPIQGAAHQLMLIAMGLLSHTPKQLPLLQDPVMEVHDALVVRVKLRDLQKAYAQFQELLEVGVPAAVKKLFGFELKVPLKCEVDAGFRYGAMVPEYDGKPVAEFLKAWRKLNADADIKAAKGLERAAWAA